MKIDVESNPLQAEKRAAVRASETLTASPYEAVARWPVVWAVVGTLILSAAFLTGQNETVARLPQSVGAFFASLFAAPVLHWRGAAESAVGAVVAALIVIAWYGAGERLRRLIDQCFGLDDGAERESLPLRLAERAAFGAGLWSLVWFAFGIAHLYSVSAAVVALLGGASLSAAMWASGRNRIAAHDTAEPSARLFEQAAGLLVALPLACAFVASLAPPTGKDALVYRLALPQTYAAAGGFVDTPGNVYSQLALGAEMNGVWALLLGGAVNARVGEAAFGALAFVYLPLLLLLVYGWAREMNLSRAWSLLAAATVAGIPTLFQVAATGYADHALALYIALGVRAAAAWWVTPCNRRLAVMATALGFALAVKLTAVFACLPLLVMILLKAREMERRSSERSNAMLLSGMTALLGAGLLASPWYFRTWAKTGNPVFPFYVNVLGGSAAGWDGERSRLFQIFLSRYGGEAKGVFDYLGAPLKLALTAQAEIAVRYDGVLGVAFLVGLPLLVWAAWRGLLRAEMKAAAALAGSYYLCWLFSSQQLRFLLPVFPCLAVATTVAAVQLTTERRAALLGWGLLGAVVPGAIVTAAWFVEQNPVRAVLGGEAREAYLSRRLEHYPYYEIINRELPPDARVWLVNMRGDTVHLKRAFVADYVFEDYTLTRMVRTARDARELAAGVRALGVTHVMIRHDVLLDYARSPIVDERRTEAENRSKLDLLKSFLTEEAKVMKSDAKYALVELRSQ